MNAEDLNATNASLSRRAIILGSALVGASGDVSVFAAPKAPKLTELIRTYEDAAEHWRTSVSACESLENEAFGSQGAPVARVKFGHSVDVITGARRPIFVYSHSEIDGIIDDRLLMFGEDPQLLAINAREVAALEAQRARLHSELAASAISVAQRAENSGLTAAEFAEANAASQMADALANLLACHLTSFADASALAQWALDERGANATKTAAAVLRAIAGRR